MEMVGEKGFEELKVCLHCGYVAKSFTEKACRKCCRRLVIRFKEDDPKIQAQTGWM